MATKPPAKPADPPDWRRLRLWHIQPVRDVLVLALVFGVLYLGWLLSPITVPMLLALLLAYLFEPLVVRLTRFRHIGRPGAAGIIIASAFFLVAVPASIGVAIAVVQTAQLAENIADQTSSLISAVQEPDGKRRQQKIEDLPRGWRSIGMELTQFRAYLVKGKAAGATPAPRPGAAEDMNAPDQAPATPPKAAPDAAPEPTPETTPTTDPAPPIASTESPDEAEPLSTWREELYTRGFAGIEWLRANADGIAKSIGQSAIATGQGALASALAAMGAVAGLLFGAFLTAFFFFFFSTGWGKVLEFWAGLIPERKKYAAFDLISKMDRVIAGFVRGRLTICAIMGIVHTLAYWLIGMPVPLIVGPIAGLLYIVPFVHLISIPVGILLLWLQPSDLDWQNHWWWIIFAPIGVDVFGQFLDDWVLSPMIQGKTTNMDAPTILFASMAGGTLGGMYGLLIAIPVAACIKILISDLFWPRFRRWARGEERDFLPIESDESAPPQRAPTTR